MEASKIREVFLRFFEERGHKVCEGISLIPSDSSVLFTVAGMVPFKDFFLGNRPLEFTRACSVQRCLRTNDLERVGKTARHLTFFEMLGNFSFGDYFKKEAIEWGFEFLTKELSLPKERLYVSVFKEDNEAEIIWKKFLPEARIVRLGESENFWKMGEEGPCGPCSEIIFDLGEDTGCKKPSCSPGCDCDRFLELWNLVFTEFERKKGGQLKPLPKKNIDTGMGLERLSAILAGKKTAFECDTIAPIIDYLTKFLPEPQTLSLESRIIADHIRAITYLIYDGIIPSNEERGYVLRSLIRKAKVCGKKLGIEEAFLYKLVYPISLIFPSLKEQQSHIANVIKLEEDRFHEVIERGLPILEEKISKSKDIFSGRELFELYDTYGFPLELAIEIIKERGLAIDLDGYHKMMDEQRERSRKRAIFSQKTSLGIDTEFIGYEMLEAECRVIKVEKDKVILDKTPFYPSSGGQVGDCGFLIKEKESLVVLDTQKIGGTIVHKIKEGFLKEGDIVLAMVDKERRGGIKRAHTATHLLQSALREILGENVRQQGSLVENDRLRFDFNYPNKLSLLQIKEIEERIYQRIIEDIEVDILKDIPIKEAKEMGALAFFEDEYGERVRLVKIGNISKELCKGTHIERTGKIGLFKITQESSVSSGIRRIEALTGRLAYRLIREDEERLKGIIELTHSSKHDVILKVENLIKENRNIQREMFSLKESILKERIGDIIKNAKEIQGIKVVFEVMNSLDKAFLLQAMDRIRESLSSGVFILGGKDRGSLLWVCRVSPDLTNKISAHSIIQGIAKITGGGGGGKKDFATGGGGEIKNIEKLKEKVLGYVFQDFGSE